MFIYPKITSLYVLDMWHWQYYPSPWCKASSLQVTWILVNSLILIATLMQNQCLNPKINLIWTTLHWNQYYLKKLHNIKMSQLTFIVTTFIQFKSTKAALDLLLHYMHDFDENLKALYSKLVTNNDIDNRSYDVRQHILTYLALLKLCSDELMDCK